jgi:hypothetical protein
MESEPHEEGVSVEGVSEEASVEALSEGAVSEKGYRRSVATGRFVVPDSWPKWKKQCGVVRRGRPPCRRWAVVGMPTCKYHGSGGELHRQRGQLRYLAWVALGARDNLTREMPIELACRVALGMFAEYIFSENTNVSTDTQVKAALWLLDMSK